MRLCKCGRPSGDNRQRGRVETESHFMQNIEKRNLAGYLQSVDTCGLWAPRSEQQFGDPGAQARLGGGGRYRNAPPRGGVDGNRRPWSTAPGGGCGQWRMEPGGLKEQRRPSGWARGGGGGQQGRPLSPWPCKWKGREHLAVLNATQSGKGPAGATIHLLAPEGAASGS